MNIDLLIAEIGSTTTVINAFNRIDNELTFIGHGYALTTVNLNDVTIGLDNAINDLCKNLGVTYIEYGEMLATSSAAGGLKMTVHGLVYDMTVTAAKEAALGAGANIHYITSGKLSEVEINKIKEISPNLILIAGGVDFGEKETVIHNAKLIAESDLLVPIIFAGNIQAIEAVKNVFSKNNKTNQLTITENVYPKIDTLNIEPVRKIIQSCFEDHITKAPGMKHIKDKVTHIMPTPGAVMEASILLNNYLGDLVTIDIGGATTDIHSVCSVSSKIELMMTSNEPYAKRTVEGDLGLYVNSQNLIKLSNERDLINILNINKSEYLEVINNIPPIPKTELELKLITELAKIATQTSLERHSGKIITSYTTLGKRTYAIGKDLSNVKYIIGTGGALTQLSTNIEILKSIFTNHNPKLLLPNDDSMLLIDHDYIMASLGVMSLKYPEDALKLLLKSLRIEG